MGNMTDQRWFAVGHSNHDEASRAGKEAAAEARALGTPKLAVVFASCHSGFHNQTLVVLAVA
jgi:hypothetical protein